MAKTIVITGPESAGKTTLSNELSQVLNLPLLPEYAREYLSELSGDYTLNDVENMAREQLNREREIVLNSNSSCVLDTDLTVYHVWLKEKYQQEWDWINDHLADNAQKIYLLMAPDLEWEYDPMREHANPSDRQRLFHQYEVLLKSNGANYHIVKGQGEERLKNAMKIVSIYF